MTRKTEPINPFLPLLKQHDPNPTSDPIELDESDVVWSDHSLSPPATSSSSPSSVSVSASASFLSLSPHRLRRGLGLSAALAADLRRNPSAARLIPPSPHHASAARALPHSAPVTVPVWTRIKIWYHEDLSDEDEEREDVAEGEERESGRGTVPPHVMMGRSGHVAAYSVFEGAGRTLKGRDLRRVRNAVFQKTGFLD